MTWAEYLALESGSDRKHEYVNGWVYAMAGGTPEHARLQGRLIQQLGMALRGRPCEAFTSGLRVKVTETGRATYPDVTIVCDRIERADDDPDAATTPTLLVEVLSESTEADDRGSKWAHYQRIPSLRHYVLVSQDEPRVEIFTREATGWHYVVHRSGPAALPALGVSLDVDDLYARALG